MNFLKSHLLWLLIFPVTLLSQPKVFAQHSEIGVRFVLSGAIMFGPCYSYWVDDHNELNFSVLAAFQGELIVPGVEFRCDNTCQNAQSKIWLAHIFDKKPIDKKFEIFPIGLDISYGYKSH